MRTSSAVTSRNSARHTRSNSRLNDFKRSVQNLGLGKRSSMINLIGGLQRNKGTDLGEIKRKGKLVLGQNNKPSVILSREERMNPWSRRGTITEELINKKGLLSLFAMGVVPRNANCHELLNNRYEMPRQIVEKQPAKQMFMTNPARLLQSQKEFNAPQPALDQQQPFKQKDKTQQIKIRRKSSKKRIVKQEVPKFELPQEILQLVIVNFHVQHNDSYDLYLKRVKRNGLEPFFKTYIAAFQKFAANHNLRKITIIPSLNQTRRLTQGQMLSSIVNHKIYGIDMKVKGSPINLFIKLLKGKIQGLRFARMQRAVHRMNTFKQYFKNKKFYQQMLTKRWQFLNFKLGSFAQNQRRFVQDKCDITQAEVEIHLLGSDVDGEQLGSYYKWNDRKKAQLTRLYNSECSHLILILNRKQQIGKWIQRIEQLPCRSVKPVIHVFFSSLADKGQYQVQVLEECADMYFGLVSQTIASIKKICWQRTSVLIPYKISSYLPQICQTLEVNLLAGTFTESSKKTLFDEEESVEIQMQESSAKFKKLSAESKQVTEFYHRRFEKIQLTAKIFQSKQKVKQFLIKMKLPTPLSLPMGVKYQDFLRDFSGCILVNKRYSRWILKLFDSTFSRGLAVLQTDSLKIIKQIKKKTVIKEEDIEQISKIMDSILVQKINIPHTSLLNGDDFMALFRRGGYAQSCIDNCTNLCVFGRIQLNGVFTFLGTYRKYYAEGVCFGALYPALQMTQTILKNIKQACNSLYQSGMFGYLTFELLVQDKSKEYYFIDLVPHLQEYSSLYFYYKRLMENNGMMVSADRLARRIFYCPFIDNNGNKCQSISEFNDLRLQKKVYFDEKSVLGTEFFFLNEQLPDVVSVVCFGKDEGTVVRQCLEALNFLVDIGGQFNKFDKKFKNTQTDGLYIMDVIWKLRQLKKQTSER